MRVIKDYKSYKFIRFIILIADKSEKLSQLTTYNSKQKYQNKAVLSRIAFIFVP